MWDLSSLTRDQTRVPFIVRRILYHWTTREVPAHYILKQEGSQHQSRAEGGKEGKGELLINPESNHNISNLFKVLIGVKL